jgi:hypothetical protein
MNVLLPDEFDDVFTMKTIQNHSKLLQKGMATSWKTTDHFRTVYTRLALEGREVWGTIERMSGVQKG